MKSISRFIQNLSKETRNTKKSIAISFDAFSITLSTVLAMFLSSNAQFESFILAAAATVLVSLLAFIILGFYRTMLRYMEVNSILNMVIGITVSTNLFWLIFTTVDITLLGVVLFGLSLAVTLGGGRLIAILLFRKFAASNTKNIIIYGAGAAGRQLSSALKFTSAYKVVAFIDDDKSLDNSKISDVPIYYSERIDSVLKKYAISEVLLAIPSVSSKRRTEIIAKLEDIPVRVKTIAGLDEIVSGRVDIDEIQELDIKDLLGRESVFPDERLLASCIEDKSVMVTGAGGSIGSELCRQIILLRPKVLVLLEISEYSLYSIERELKTTLSKNGLPIKLIPILGTVQNKSHLLSVMKTFAVQTVYHAAAYKHVPIVEHNIIEGVRNNVFGTWNAAEAAVAAGVEKFVLISTDKAVRPTNIMGASKRLAELVLQAIDQRKTNTTVTMVRFGNVLGSSGSVVPLFREQIKSGGPVTVTHKDIIRYFMTIPEASQLVIQAGAMGRGGDVFVLDMGEPVKIAALAEKMIHLMGRTVKSESLPPGIEIKYTGLRPGEKLYEELLIGENVEGTDHQRIMTANEDFLTWDEMEKVLQELDQLCLQQDCEGIRSLLLKVPTGYNPQHNICDLIWTLRNSPLEAETSKTVVQFSQSV